MTPEAATLIRGALALNLDERAVVANTLLESLHPDEVDAAWRAEGFGRLEEARSGNVDLIDADEHYARLRAEFAADAASPNPPLPGSTAQGCCA